MTETITFESFAPDHLDGALRLSQQAGWPHRRADWELVTGLSQGIAAIADGKVVGTALATPFGPVAMANMIIVDAAMRGRGLGRALMERVLALLQPQEWRLVATNDGLPLYRKLGFRETGRIVQMQGQLGPVVAPQGVEWAGPQDLPAIAALDAMATGADRIPVLAQLVSQGRLAVLRGPIGGVQAFAALRPFGRGWVAGPVVARDVDQAERLLSFLFADRPGDFLRVDTPEGAGLEPWLQAQGLAPVGGGITMQMGRAPARPAPFLTFALAAQALG